MSNPRIRRPRDPVATREAILAAARHLVARDGPESMSVSAVAALAGINRGTAYQHFATRDELLAATMASVSDELFRAAFGDPATVGERRVEDVDVLALTTTLADFAVDNPLLCRIWFLQLLASDRPADDPFWREYAGSLRRFAATDLAEPGIDSEVFALLMIAGNFLWPVWSHAHEKDARERRELARRFANESLRLSMHGSMRADRFPEVEAMLGVPAGRATPRAARAA